MRARLVRSFICSDQASQYARGWLCNRTFTQLRRRQVTAACVCVCVCVRERARAAQVRTCSRVEKRTRPMRTRPASFVNLNKKEPPRSRISPSLPLSLLVSIPGASSFKANERAISHSSVVYSECRSFARRDSYLNKNTRSPVHYLRGEST